MNIIGWLLALYIGVFSAFGSASSSDADVTVEEMPAPSATATPDPVPDGGPDPKGEAQIEQRFLTRAPLPTCGMVTSTEQPGQAPPDTVWGCLQHAVETGEGAELVRVETTVEGGTVFTYYRVDPDGTLEIYTDLRQDPYAARSWSYRTCEPSADVRKAPCQGDS